MMLPFYLFVALCVVVGFLSIFDYLEHPQKAVRR